MKEKELRKAAKCGICGKKIGASGLPMFFRLRIRQYVLDVYACQRQQGLGLMLGGVLAQKIGPNDDLAKKMSEREITVCIKCATEKQVVVAGLAE